MSARTVQRTEKTGRGKWSSYRLMAKTLGVAERELVADQVPRPLIELRWASGVGVFLTMPVLAFFATNVIRHQFGFDTLLQFHWVDILSPFVFIGGCAIALVLNLGASIGFDLDIRQDALIPRRLVIYMSSSNLFLIILMATMALAMLGYALLENLVHWIEPRLKKTFVRPYCKWSRSAWLLVTIIGLSACHQVAPELSAGAENWQIYRSPQYGFAVSYPPKPAIQLHYGGRDVLLRFEDYPVVAVNISSNAEAKQRGLWAWHEPVGTETVDGRVASKYEYLHCDGFFCMATVSLVVPYREAYLAVEFRTDNKVLDNTQRRILDSVRIND